MKIAFFGDSYADIGMEEFRTGTAWPEVLSKLLSVKKSGYYAVCGSSIWHAYNELKKYIYEYDVIVFCYSSAYRWPCLPDHLIGNNYLVHSYDDRFPEMSKYVDVYRELFTDDFLEFVSGSIFTAVNELCKKHDKFLINICCFGKEFNRTSTEYPIFYNIDKVSINEIVVQNNKTVTMREVIHVQGNNDKRQCHLNTSNNKILAEIFKDVIENKTSNLESDLYSEYEWVRFDPEVNKWFGK